MEVLLDPILKQFMDIKRFVDGNSPDSICDARHSIAKNSIEHLSEPVRNILLGGYDDAKNDQKNIIKDISCDSLLEWCECIYKRNDLVQIIKQDSIIIHKMLCKVDNFEDKFGLCLENARYTGIVVDIFHLLCKNECSLLPLSLIFPLFERLIADIWYSWGIRNPKSGEMGVPFLAQMIVSDRVKEALGCPLSAVIDTVFGSPTGLNLRNLSWHGFLDLNTVPIELVSTTFALFLATSHTPASVNASNDRTELSRGKSNIKEENLLPGATLSEVWSVDCQFSDVDDLLTCSIAVVPGRRNVWISALNYFRRGFYLNALVLLLPALEQSLRRLYIAAHNPNVNPSMIGSRIPTADLRKLFATNDVLFTSLEDITSIVLEGDVKNCLFSESMFKLPDSIIRAYSDLFVWGDGPCVRDKVAHGQCDLNSISYGLACNIMVWALNLATWFDPNGKKASIISLISNESWPKFHPRIILRKSIAEYIGSTVHDFENFFKEIGYIGSYEVVELTKRRYDPVSELSFSFFPDNRELSVVDGLRRILDTGKRIFDHYKDYLSNIQTSISNHTASSRSRKAFSRVIISTPTVYAQICSCYQIAEIVDGMIGNVDFGVLQKFVTRSAGLLERERMQCEDHKFQLSNDDFLKQFMVHLNRWISKIE